MKKSILIALLIALVALPSIAQWRLDIGVDVPRGVGAVVGSDVLNSEEAGTILSSSFFPFPEASIYYTFGGGTMLQAGATTLLSKESAVDELYAAIRQALADEGVPR